MPITRIQWTSEENKKVAIRWIEICARDHMDPLKPLRVTKLVTEAQQVLPIGRHRPENGIKGMTAVEKLFEVVKIEIKKPKLDISWSPPAGDGDQGNNHQLSFDPPPLDGFHNPRESQSTMNLESMFSAFGKSIADILVSEIKSALLKTFNEEFPKLHAQALAVSKTLPRILICGPLPKQQPTLELAVDGVVELKFVSSEESPKLVGTRGKNCTACVLWIDFISHAHQNAAKALFSNSRTILVSGGIDTLRAKTEEVALMVSESNS